MVCMSVSVGVRVGVWCVCVVCLCVVCVSVYLINTYLQPVPLDANTTCSGTHVIHCLSFSSVFGTTCGNLFRTMTNYRRG